MIIVPKCGWFNTFQRPHHFAKFFRERFFTEVFFELKALPHIGYGFMNEQKSLVDAIHYIRILRGDRYKLIRAFNNPLKRFQYSRVAKCVFAACDLVYTWNVDDVEYLDYCNDKFIIYDAMDDWSAFDGIDSARIAENELRIVSKSSLVLAVSEKIRARLAKYNPNTFPVRNGVDADYFARAKTYAKTAADKLWHLRDKNVVGYIGHLREWVDTDLIVESAKRLPDIDFVIIGPGNETIRQKLSSCPNILYLGAIPYSDLIQFIAYFNVGVIPFAMNALNESTNPIKLYEYLGAGLPVVATAINETAHYAEPGVVFTSQTADEFISMLPEAMRLCNNTQLVARRMQIAESNSWRRRVDEIFRLIDIL
jgi:glycosyltransferase involved in cell wall biosynthesis